MNYLKKHVLSITGGTNLAFTFEYLIGPEKKYFYIFLLAAKFDDTITICPRIALPKNLLCQKL